MTSMRPAPATARVTQGYYGGFSAKISGSAYHGGTDFGCPVGTPILAPDDMTIVFAGWCWDLPGGPNDWAARWYQLKPARGNTRVGGGIMTVGVNSTGSHWIKAHLSNNNMVKAGQRVRRGDVIGLSGNTGSSTGPHLHLGLVPRNPNWGNGGYGAINAEPWLTIPYKPNGATRPPAAGSGSGTGSSAASPLPKFRLELVEGRGRNFTPAANVPAVYGGRSRVVKSFTVHWWDDPAKKPTHDGSVSWVQRPGGDTSAHYVVSKGRVTRTVHPKDAAWANGSAEGNATTISIECDPNDPEGTLPTVAALIRDLQSAYGKLPIYPHDHWSATTCPGSYKALIPKLKAMVTQGVTTTPTGDWFDTVDEKRFIQLSKDIVGGEIRHHLKPGNRESKIVFDGLSWVIGQTINHYLSPNTKEGKVTLGRVAAAVAVTVLASKIPGRGVAKGDMAVVESLGWDRNARSISESQAKQILANQERLEAKLDALAVATVAEGKHVNKEGA